MGENTFERYIQLLHELRGNDDTPSSLYTSFKKFSLTIYRSDEQNKYSEPMPWIGIYIALASLLCMLAMVADLLYVIAVAMKLPVDLNTLMPGNVDQGAKLGSMSFLCTMMANSLPSLAMMDSNELVSNIIALGILVITVVVNVCIQIKTGVVSHPEDKFMIEMYSGYGTETNFFIIYSNPYKMGAIIYVVMLLMLLIIHTSSALTVEKSKQLLESKYQKGHETALKDLELKQPGILTVEKLKLHVKKYWIMVGTGSPQFMTVCSATTSASGVICALSTIIHIFIMLLMNRHQRDYNSDYKWSMSVILITLFIAVLLGTIAPVSRCFADLSFKLSIKLIWNHIKVFKVESYWTQKLCDWKQSRIPFSVTNRKIKSIIQNIKILILNFCIIFQKAVVVSCKTISLIPIFFVTCILYCIRCWKWLKSYFTGSCIALVNRPSQHDTSIDLHDFVLKYQDDMELNVRTFRKILNCMDNLIKKAEKKQPYNLMKLLEGSRGFEGVESFDSQDVLHLLSEEPLHCWSLPVVTLTCIALSLPNIQKNRIDKLLRSVSEGLVYVTLVEESLNAKDDYINIKKAAEMLWLELEVSHKWLGNNLQNLAPQLNTAGQILEWFKHASKKVVAEVKSTNIENPDANSIRRSVCANSMYRISETFLLSYRANNGQVGEEELFVQISSTIADILAACLTNLPKVISMKCHECAIEKREASVNDAVLLLGKTQQIINSLQDRKLPGLNPDEFPFIEKWRANLRHTSP